MIRKGIFVLLILTSLFFLGCGTTKKRLEPLEDIKPSFSVKTQWVKRVGEMGKREHRQLPVYIAEDKVFVANTEGEVRALDISRGKAIWATQLKDKISSGPSFGKGMVLIGTHDAEVIAIDAANGQEKWRSQVSSEVLALPLVVDDKVIVQTIDGRIFALQVDGGKRIWVAAREVPVLTLRGTSTPLVLDGKLIAGFADGELVAFDLTTGKTLWESAIGIPTGRTDLQRMVDIDGIFQVQNNVIYVTAYQDRIAAIATVDDRAIWTRDMSSYTGVCLDKQHVYTTDSDGYVWSLDIDTGATLWRQDKLVGRDLTAPVLMGDTVVVADRGGYVHWLSKEDDGFTTRENIGQVYKRVMVNWGDEDMDARDIAVTTPLVVVNDALFVRDNAGAVSVFKIAAKRK